MCLASRPRRCSREEWEQWAQKLRTRGATAEQGTAPPGGAEAHLLGQEGRCDGVIPACSSGIPCSPPCCIDLSLGPRLDSATLFVYPDSASSFCTTVLNAPSRLRCLFSVRSIVPACPARRSHACLPAEGQHRRLSQEEQIISRDAQVSIEKIRRGERAACRTSPGKLCPQAHARKERT